MRYLLTGGAGFVGTHLAQTLTARGDHATILDLRTPTKIVAGAYYVRGDVRDGRLVGSLVQQTDGVFHLAAVVGFANVMGRMLETVTTNTLGTETVLHYADLCRKRVLLTSTSACYGRGVGAVKETDDGTLGPSRTGSWAYAYAKAADECLGFAYHQERQLPVIVARLFNTVGPGQSAEAGFVLPRFVGQALSGDDLTVYRPGTQTRTFAHVTDISWALSRLMECDQAVGELVNVGGNTTVTVQGLAEQVIAVTQSASRIAEVEQPYGAGYDDIHDRKPDIAKIRRLTGWQPRLTLDDMIADVAVEYLAAHAP
jgi:nucleoside-diphosphate-sugar epimerase